MIHEEATTIVKRMSRKATQIKLSLGGIDGVYSHPQLIAEADSLEPLAVSYGLLYYALQADRVVNVGEWIAKEEMTRLAQLGRERPYKIDANMLEGIHQCAPQWCF